MDHDQAVTRTVVHQISFCICAGGKGCCPLWAARNKGVCPVGLKAFGSAPETSSCFIEARSRVGLASAF